MTHFEPIGWLLQSADWLRRLAIPEPPGVCAMIVACGSRDKCFKAPILAL